MERLNSEKAQRGGARRQKMRSSLDVPQSTTRSGAPSSSRSIHAEPFQVHRSFHRTYREGCTRELNVPGTGQHIYESFQMIFANWKLFLPLLLISAATLVLTVGVTDFFSTTAGVFYVVVALTLWLVTIFLVRQKMAGHEVGLRDGLYNAMAPLIAVFVVLAVVAIECVPIILVVVAYSAAVQTEFLAMPFYAILFWGFAALMVTVSGYLLSSSLIALVAVTAPGIYPLKALQMATELMMGRKIKFLIRILVLIFVLLVMWGVVILPLAALKVPEVVMVVAGMTLGCFSCIYVSCYIYLYYRWMLDT